MPRDRLYASRRRPVSGGSRSAGGPSGRGRARPGRPARGRTTPGRRRSAPAGSERSPGGHGSRPGTAPCADLKPSGDPARSASIQPCTVHLIASNAHGGRHTGVRVVGRERSSAAMPSEMGPCHQNARASVWGARLAGEVDGAAAARRSALRPRPDGHRPAASAKTVRIDLERPLQGGLAFSSRRATSELALRLSVSRVSHARRRWVWAMACSTG